MNTAKRKWIVIPLCLFLLVLSTALACQSQAAAPVAPEATAVVDVAPEATAVVDVAPEATVVVDVAPQATAVVAAATTDPGTAPEAPPVEAPAPAEAALELSRSEDYGQAARQYLEALANDIGGRWPGTEEDAAAAEFIQEAFEELGYAVEVQPFTFYDEDEEADMDAANLIVVHEGLSEQQIIVGAHYDSGDEADGADDNASGVAVLLEVAGLVRGVDTPYTIVFIAFGAEENDLDGSRHYVNEMSSSEVANTIAMINLDSLIAGDLAYVYGDAGPGTLRDWILDLAASADIPLEGKTAAEMDNDDGTPCACADYDAFQRAGIPFAYFEATNWNLGAHDGMTQVDPQYGDGGEVRHTQYDTLEYIEATFPGRIDHHLNLFVTLLLNTLQAYK